MHCFLKYECSKLCKYLIGLYKLKGRLHERPLRQALKFFLNSLIFYVFHGLKTELIISRLEQDEYYSLMKEIILLFANTHHSINATILLRFVPKMLDVSGELLVMSYMELYDLIVFHSQFILNLTR